MNEEQLLKALEDFAKLSADHGEMHPCALVEHDGTMDIITTLGDVSPTQLLLMCFEKFPGSLVGVAMEAWGMQNPPPGVDMRSMTPEERREKGVYTSLVARVFRDPSMKALLVSSAKVTDDRVVTEFKRMDLF